MQAKTYAEAGPEFDPNDIRFNCFRYVVSDFPNAMGKHWVDPRSGEILQADVLFHSNVITLLRNGISCKQQPIILLHEQKHCRMTSPNNYSVMPPPTR